MSLGREWPFAGPDEFGCCPQIPAVSSGWALEGAMEGDIQLWAGRANCLLALKEKWRAGW